MTRNPAGKRVSRGRKWPSINYFSALAQIRQRRVATGDRLPQASGVLRVVPLCPFPMVRVQRSVPGKLKPRRESS